MAQSMTEARGSKIYMDEPQDLGGDDKAPSPLAGRTARCSAKSHEIGPM